jgi:hypothetical protein
MHHQCSKKGYLFFKFLKIIGRNTISLPYCKKASLKYLYIKFSATLFENLSIRSYKGIVNIKVFFMKTTTLLLGIAIGVSQITPLVCMDETNYETKEIKEEQSQLAHYTYPNFNIDHFILRIDSDLPNEMQPILDDLFQQQDYVSSISTTNTVLFDIVTTTNTTLTQLRDNFFAKLKKYQESDPEIMQEIEKAEGSLSWITQIVPHYNIDVVAILAKFANTHNLHRT